MRQATLAILAVVLCLPLILFASPASEPMTSRILTSTPGQTVVAAEFDAVTLAQRAAFAEPGADLSEGLGLMLAIPGHGMPVATVRSVELGDPVQTTQSLSGLDVASSESDLVSVGQPAILHDLRVVAVGFKPFMIDDQGVMRVVRRVETAVANTGSGSVNEINDPLSISGAWEPIYRSALANLDQLYPEIAVRAPGRYLVIVPTRRMEMTGDLGQTTIFRNWLDLKKRKGYTMQIATLRAIHQAVSDSTEAGIKQYITAQYNDHSQPDIDYVLIIADHVESQPIRAYVHQNPEQVLESSVGDNEYCTVAGSDYLPDLLCGRVTGRSVTEYVTYFAKVVRYETQPPVDDMSWYSQALCAAGNFSESGLTVTPVWNANWAREELMHSGLITVADTFYWHDGNDPDPENYEPLVVNNLNLGRSLVIYRGWAASTQWHYPLLRSAAFYPPTSPMVANGEKTPAVFSVVCGTGNFGYGTDQCLGETFLTGGAAATVSQSNGAIIFFGASDVHTNTRHNNAILAGMINAMTHNNIRSGGALQVAGKLEGWRQFPREHVHPDYPSDPFKAFAFYYVLHVFNLLGDPETQIYVGTPSALDVNIPQPIPAGQSLIPVQITAGGAPVENAVVTLRDTVAGAPVRAARTDAAGYVYLPATFAGTTRAQVTAWQGRHFLRRMDVQVSGNPFEPQITGVNWTAGADNLPNPGEAASFTLNVRNLGNAATTLTATLTSLDPRVTVTAGAGSVSAIPVGETRTSSSFSIQLAGDLMNGEQPRLALALVDGGNSITREVFVPVAAPDPQVLSLRVVDSGNANGILESGETAQIYVTAKNIGGQDAANLTVAVDTWDNAVVVQNANAAWTQLARNQTAESGTAFSLQMQNNVTPGRQILLHLVFSQNSAVVARKSYLLPTGVVTIHSPTGPDAYGYYAYENIDNGFAATPNFEWVELDPNFGGSGADAHDVRDESFYKMPLPRPFTYYGQAYDSVWICSNGWFSFGAMLQPEFRNWELPSPIGAPALIAPLWDDLVGERMLPNDDSTYSMWTRYDGPQNRFVIQWRNFARGGMVAGDTNDAACTFEAILEYPSSGNGSILLQYQAYTPVDDRWGAGNYATVGWEDWSHERGLTLCFSNSYPASVDSLRPGRAIRITTQAPDAFTGVGETPQILPRSFALYDPAPNPFNPVTDLRFDLPVNGYVALRVYDMLGREVATLVDGVRAAGSYKVQFDGGSLASGLYFARLSSASGVQVRKLMLVK